jgi:dihydropteroate synthase
VHYYPTLDLPLSFPCLMGILNVTPDSFSDGGQFEDVDGAVARGLQMVREGAAIVDVGGESTRPGAEGVSADEELRRVLPVVERLHAQSEAYISIDTMKAAVAARAVAAGATVVNDVSALRHDPQMLDVVATSGCACCLMHMRGVPRTMQDAPRYADVVGEVAAFLEKRLAHITGYGVREEQVLLDPGIGFGKTVEHNLLLLNGLDKIAALGRPVVLGTSRKRFLGALLNGAGVAERATATAATTVLGALAGAAVFRVHDVRANREALRVALAVMHPEAAAMGAIRDV